MAQTDTGKLDVGDRFPLMSVQVIDEAVPWQLPDDQTSEFTIFLVYRGKW